MRCSRRRQSHSRQVAVSHFAFPSRLKSRRQSYFWPVSHIIFVYVTDSGTTHMSLPPKGILFGLAIIAQFNRARTNTNCITCSTCSSRPHLRTVYWHSGLIMYPGLVYRVLAKITCAVLDWDLLPLQCVLQSTSKKWGQKSPYLQNGWTNLHSFWYTSTLFHSEHILTLYWINFKYKWRHLALKTIISFRLQNNARPLHANVRAFKIPATICMIFWHNSTPWYSEHVRDVC